MNTTLKELLLIPDWTTLHLKLRDLEAELRELKEYEKTRVDQLIIVRHAIIAVIEEILGEEP